MTEHVGAVRALQFHPHFEVLVSAGDAKFLVIWDSNTGRLSNDILIFVILLLMMKNMHMDYCIGLQKC